jgi:hypothetical protein
MNAELQRRRLQVPFVAHDLLAELDGKPLSFSDELQVGVTVEEDVRPRASGTGT